MIFHKYHAPVDELPAGGIGPALPGTNGIDGESGQERDHRVESGTIPAFERYPEQYGDDVAAIIMEPISGNCGLLPPLPGYTMTIKVQTDPVLY